MGTVGAASIVSPEDQSVTFVELFFDLVFVFSVTQVAGLLHHHLDWTGLGQAVLVFWLVWTGHSQRNGRRRQVEDTSRTEQGSPPCVSTLCLQPSEITIDHEA